MKAIEIREQFLSAADWVESEKHANDTFADVTADHLPHGASFRLLGA